MDQLKTLFNGKKFDEAFRGLPAFLQKRIVPDRSADKAQERLRNIQNELSQTSPNLSKLTDELLWLDGMVGVFKEYQRFTDEGKGLRYSTSQGAYGPHLFDDHFPEAGAVLNNAFFDTAGGVGGKGPYAELVAARFGFHPEQGTLTAYFAVKVKGYPDSEAVSTGDYAISVPLDSNPEAAVTEAMRQFTQDKDVQKPLKKQYRNREQAMGRRDDYEAGRAEKRDRTKARTDYKERVHGKESEDAGKARTELIQRILDDHGSPDDYMIVWEGEKGRGGRWTAKRIRERTEE